MNNSVEQQEVTFDEETVEDLAEHVFHHGKRAHVAECYVAPGFVSAATVISWLADDTGHLHYVVSDSADGFEYTNTVDKAWEIAVEFTCHLVDPEYPVDVAFDERIPARAYGDRAELEARGLPKA